MPSRSDAFTRRRALAGLGSLTFLATLGPARAIEPPAKQVADLEAKLGGRLGVYVSDATGRVLIAHRDTEHFPMCSTFKFLLAAAALKRAEQGSVTLDQVLPYTQADLLSYAPVTKANVGKGGMSLHDLCAAAVTLSDNTAANLVMRAIGGPAAVTAYARSIGDNDTQLDRMEPELNSAIPGDPRDTTTPRSIAEDMRRILAGDALSPPSLQMLEGWMTSSKTGLKRLRAGVPSNWTVADKTGSGANATANTIALMRPPGRPPMFAAVYITGATAAADALDAGHAEVGRIIADMVRRS
ncbi:MAG: class A beta-lactamase [Proteobacteria bacterium]|nr:class A beta-lactamase [Pseudomonadota bacterium]